MNLLTSRFIKFRFLPIFHLSMTEIQRKQTFSSSQQIQFNRVTGTSSTTTINRKFSFSFRVTGEIYHSVTSSTSQPADKHNSIRERTKWARRIYVSLIETARNGIEWVFKRINEERTDVGHFFVFTSNVYFDNPKEILCLSQNPSGLTM